MKRVTRSNPCPVCGKPDWCGISEDGCMAVCMRLPSSTPSKNGGWAHVVKASTERAPFQPPPPTRLKRLFDAAKYHAAIRADWDHVWNDGTALSLDVDMDALDRLQPGYDGFNKAVGFPMRDADGKVIGIRLRNFMAQKWAVSGSMDGLFFDPSLTLGPEKELVVCEGPTDTAAAYTLGLCAVGRSACKTGTDLLKALCKRLGARLVTIISDNDGWKECAGKQVRPGLDGAVSLGKDLGRYYRIVVPPKKDLRAWLADGLSLKNFNNYADVALKRVG